MSDDHAPHHRWSVAQYQRMVEVGLLTDEDKVELLENDIVLKTPRTPRHDGTTSCITHRFWELLSDDWSIRCGSSIVLPDSQPEPDLAIVRGDHRSYLTRHPGPADVGLVIEVADTSLFRDQRIKTRIYARAGIPVYWIVNLVDQRVEVYSQPSGPTAVPAYGAFQVYQPGDAVPLVLDGAAVAAVPAADLLP